MFTQSFVHLFFTQLPLGLLLLLLLNQVLALALPQRFSELERANFFGWILVLVVCVLALIGSTSLNGDATSVRRPHEIRLVLAFAGFFFSALHLWRQQRVLWQSLSLVFLLATFATSVYTVQTDTRMLSGDPALPFDHPLEEELMKEIMELPPEADELPPEDY